MTYKKLFKKKKSPNYYIMFLILLTIALLFYFFYFYKKDIFFNIKTYNKAYYIIPNEKGGKQIPNQNKKGLHLSYKDNNFFQIEDYENLRFSIQIFSSNNYDLVKNKRLNIINKKKSIFTPESLSIVMFQTSLGREYFLIYKNFASRLIATKYCEKYVYFVDKCLIVNVQNL